MTMLTINGLKEALDFVQNHAGSFKFSSDGFILIDDSFGFTQEQKYHLYVAQKLEPKLVARYTDTYTVLSLNGQMLLDILSDDDHLDFLRSKLKTYGYSTPTDRLVFNLLFENMKSLSSNNANQLPTLPEFFKSFFDAALIAKDNSKTTIIPIDEVEPATKLIESPEPIEPETISEAARIIKNTKNSKQERAEA